MPEYTQTTVRGIIKPTLGGAEGNWGTYLHTGADTADQYAARTGDDDNLNDTNGHQSTDGGATIHYHTGAAASTTIASRSSNTLRLTDASGFAVGDRVRVTTSSTGTLPTGLSDAKEYYILTKDTPVADDITLGNKPGGNTVSLSGDGTGTNTVTLVPLKNSITVSSTGDIAITLGSASATLTDDGTSAVLTLS